MNGWLNTLIEAINSGGEWFWQQGAAMFIQVSILVALLGVIDFCLRRRSRAVFRYFLWLLVLVKLVLPADFASPFGIGNWLGEVNLAETDTISKILNNGSSGITNLNLVEKGGEIMCLWVWQMNHRREGRGQGMIGR